MNTGSLRPSGTDTATDFVALALPILSAHHSIYYLKIGCRHPYRKLLQIIVMSVIGVISLYLKGFHMTVPK